MSASSSAIASRSSPLIADSLGVERPDAVSKTTGQFAFSSDLWMEGMLWGATLRSPISRGRIQNIDATEAMRVNGVKAVLTHADIPGAKCFGLSLSDQPVLAEGDIRYAGEPIALVAATAPFIARQALERIHVSFDKATPITDPEVSLHSEELLHSRGNVIRHLRIRRGSMDSACDVVVRGKYETGAQDQLALGPESALAVPTTDGGIEIYVSTQDLYEDLRQLSASLNLPPEKVHINLSGIGGAFGAKEDISVQIHCALLALKTGRPVKMVYSREESFVGRPHRHPARMEYEHRATREGRIVLVRARIVLDAGAYASTSSMVAKNAAAFAVGPYDVPNVSVDCYAVYTNNPPAGSMRGMGATQVCFAYEAQMNRLAEKLNMDPLKLRGKNALHDNDRVATGQALRGACPVSEIIRRLSEFPLPSAAPPASWSLESPGGVSNTTHGEGMRRGVGYSIGIKGFCFSEGRDDSSTARVRVSALDGLPVVQVESAAAEMGQGVNAVQVRIARAQLHVDRVLLRPANATIGSAGSSSASRQTYMTGGAVHLACHGVREQLFARTRERFNRREHLYLTSDGICDAEGLVTTIADLLGGETVEHTATYEHRRTYPLDRDEGQGDAFVSFMFSGHRAVVDVDCELGLIRVVELAAVQDVGRVISQEGVEGQIEGGSAQGLGLAVMEEVLLGDGHIRNPSLTDYLIPTSMDMPPLRMELLEFPDPDSPLGVKGAGEAPTVTSGAAIVAAVERAVGTRLCRVPIRPSDLVKSFVPDEAE